MVYVKGGDVLGQEFGTQFRADICIMLMLGVRKRSPRSSSSGRMPRSESLFAAMRLGWGLTS
jgi:hypothetical protein